MRGVRIVQGPQDFVNGIQRGSHNLGALMLRLSHQQEVVNINVDAGKGGGAFGSR